MQENKVLYTILSVIALIIVIIGIVFAWIAWKQENNNLNENSILQD